MNRENALGARRIAKQTAIPLGTVNAILTRDRKSLLADSNRGALQLLGHDRLRVRHRETPVF
jgi:hypothetical protein